VIARDKFGRLIVKDFYGDDVEAGYIYIKVDGGEWIHEDDCQRYLMDYFGSKPVNGTEIIQEEVGEDYMTI
jgi:hypothetical protein